MGLSPHSPFYPYRIVLPDCFTVLLLSLFQCTELTKREGWTGSVPFGITRGAGKAGATNGEAWGDNGVFRISKEEAEISMVTTAKI